MNMKNKKTENQINYDGQNGTDGSRKIDVEKIRQNSNYSKDNKPVPDNNIFFEERSNPLSSKGN